MAVLDKPNKAEVTGQRGPFFPHANYSSTNENNERPALKAGQEVPLGRLELPFLAPEANALSTELQGRVS
jgi:hypothetical protein